MLITKRGGEGKSTLVRRLAVELTKQKHKVLLADLDIQQKTSQEWAARRKRNKTRYKFTC